MNPEEPITSEKAAAYRTESTKAPDDEQVSALVHIVAEKAKENIIGKRDYALLLFFVTTSMRRNEAISLRGSDVELKSDHPHG